MSTITISNLVYVDEISLMQDLTESESNNINGGCSPKKCIREFLIGLWEGLSS